MERELDLQNIALQFPKTELHLHLDGSLSEEFILAKSRQYGLEIEYDSHGGVRNYLHEMKARHRKQCLERGKLNNAEKNQNWPHFDFMNQFLQSSEDLAEATEDLCRQLQNQHVWLAEIRFCPSLHTLKGLTEDEVVRAVVKGFQNGKANSSVWRLAIHLHNLLFSLAESPFEGGIIVCALRSYDTSHFESMIHLTKQWLGQGVVGFDIAGDEGTYPIQMHLESLQYAISLGENFDGNFVYSELILFISRNSCHRTCW